MAVGQALLSGGIRLSSTSNLITQSFSTTITVSAIMDLEFVVPANASDYVVSIANFSAANFISLQANNVCRVNFGGLGNLSYISNASAGMQFTNFIWAGGSGASGPLSVRLANSGSDSSTVRLIMATS